MTLAPAVTSAFTIAGLLVAGCALLAWLAWWLSGRAWRSDDVDEHTTLPTLDERKRRRDRR